MTSVRRRAPGSVAGALVALLAAAAPAAAQSPDSLREDFRRSLLASTRAVTAPARAARLDAARRHANAYATVTADSTLFRQLDRFERWPDAARHIKVRADSLRRAGYERYPRDGAAAAMPAWRESRRLATAIGDSAGLAATLGNLGAGHLALGELDSAAATLGLSRLMAERVGDWRTVGNALGLLGSLHRARGDLDGAHAMYTRAIAARDRTRDDRGAAADENNLGLVAEELGDTAGARLAYQRALARNRRAGRVSEAATNLGNLGALALASDRLAEAERLYREALALHRRADARPAVALDLRNLGTIALRRGEYPAAVTLLSESAEILAVTGPAEELAYTAADLAQAWAAMGDLDRAHDAVTAGEQAAWEAGPAALALLALTDADLAVDAEAYGDATRAYARAESLAVLGDDMYTATAAREGLGSMLLRRGDVPGAVRTLSAAVAAQREAGDDRGAALTALALGAAHAAQGAARTAERTLEDARMALRAAGDPVGEAAALAALGDVVLAAEPARAEALYREGLRVLAGRPAPDVALTLRWSLGRALLARGDLPGAERQLHLAVEAGASMRRRSPELHADLARLQHRLGRDADAFATSERLRADAGIDPVPGLAAVAARLARDEALVEYLVTDSITLAFVVTRGGVRTVTLPVGRRALAAAVAFTRATLVHDGARGTAPWAPPLRRLHRLLLAPLEQGGSLRGVSRLVVVPHAELHYLPFAALVPVAGGHLVERYEITHAPSAAAWLALSQRERAPARGMVLAVAPFPDELPGSRDEARAIGRLHGPAATVLIGGEATETAFRTTAAGHDVIHLATYGVLNRRNPLYSYVAFAPEDGNANRMEVHEVQRQRLQARVLVLSACETGLAAGARADVPAGEDWVGLVRAFLDAGADNVLATLWPIDDRATSRLMPRFHEALRTASPAAALARIQREALRSATTAAPRHWAAFVAVGGGDGRQ